MTTDNRTNEPTEAMVEAAAKALYANKTGSERGFEHTLFRRTWLQSARTALVAAQGAANLLRDDAWLTEYTRVKQAEALEEAASATENEAPGEPHAGATFQAHAAWLRARAAEYREGSET